ncbi:MAG: aldolase catalytic domain-containing protein [Clostridia bacterium]|nr:aldolase catalytic domain-containing protein [Clostridia bacterium]
MGQIKLLDCTLRDGGYINDWNFGHDNLVSVFERLVDAGVDIIEVGFLDERRPFDMDRSIMPNTDCMEKIYGDVDKKQAMVVGMIDYGTCGLENITPADESFLDGIRVIFKKHLREEAMAYCGELKKLGYKVFAQLVSVTSYNEEEMLDLVRLANHYKPYAVSMVDTYGLMHRNNLMYYFQILNENLDPEIGIGYHAHNNFQMGYANCIAMLSKKINRLMIVDGTIYGMGKSAGNAPIELVAMHMNQSLDKNYQISQILEAIDSNIAQFCQQTTWGYNMFYYLAASNDCHPNYVTYLMDKRTLSVSSINEILGKLEGEKKLLYDKNYIERLYVDYQKNEINDTEYREALARELCGKKILLIGPGASIKHGNEREKVIEYMDRENPVVISINFLTKRIKPDFVFLSNSKRYVQLATKFAKDKHRVIATSNVTETTAGAFEFKLNYSTLIDEDAEIIDNSLMMLLKTLADIGVEKVALAGFDGYSIKSANYYNRAMEYDFVKKKADYLNKYTKDFLESIKDKVKVEFVTSSHYEEESV